MERIELPFQNVVEKIAIEPQRTVERFFAAGVLTSGNRSRPSSLPTPRGDRYRLCSSERGQAVNYGGIGARHPLAEEIDGRVQLLKRHLPYQESGHVLNLAFNALLDGQQLEDIELRRNDEAFLDGLGAQRIPNPTTSGDLTRSFDREAMVELMEAINSTRQWV